MEFREYMHIEKLASDEVEGILEGKCWVFPKIDGTNASVWLSDGKLQFGSRKRHLHEGSDNAGFLVSNKDSFNLLKLLSHNPSWRLYGEWLVPHTLKTYSGDAWRKFYVFDVFDEATQRYLPYGDYCALLHNHDIEYIHPLRVYTNPTEEALLKPLHENTFLIEDGKGIGEGIVIKRYDFVNKYGRQTWAKLVTNDFKAKHARNSTPEVTELQKTVEEKVIASHLHYSTIEKVYAKLTQNETWSSKLIPQLLGTVWHDFVTEEIWDILKKHKNPTLDFARLQRLVNARTKEVLNHLL